MYGRLSCKFLHLTDLTILKQFLLLLLDYESGRLMSFDGICLTTFMHGLSQVSWQLLSTPNITLSLVWVWQLAGFIVCKFMTLEKSWRNHFFFIFRKSWSVDARLHPNFYNVEFKCSLLPVVKLVSHEKWLHPRHTQGASIQVKITAWW